MAERAYDPEIAHIVPLLPTETDWSDIPAARVNMMEMLASMPAPVGVSEDQVRFEDCVIPGPADQSFAGTVTMCTKDAQLSPLTETTGGVWDVPADLRLEVPVQFSKPTDYAATLTFTLLG